MFKWLKNFILDITFKQFLKGLMLYLTIAGIVTFSCFILEESFQTAMFGTWPAQDAQRWDIVLEGTDIMEKTIDTLNIVNYSCGWIQPLGFVSYRAYAKAERYYIKALRAKVFAYEPSLFLNREVELSFGPKRTVSRNESHWVMSSGKIDVLYSECPERTETVITGILRRDNEGLFIDKRIIN